MGVQDLRFHSISMSCSLPVRCGAMLAMAHIWFKMWQKLQSLTPKRQQKTQVLGESLLQVCMYERKRKKTATAKRCCIDSMSGFKNDHFRKCDVFVLGGDDASHSLPPLLPPFQSWGVLCIALPLLEKWFFFYPAQKHFQSYAQP